MPGGSPARACCTIACATTLVSPANGEKIIDQAVAEDAAILTAIGIVTAFGLLLSLMVVIYILGLVDRRFDAETSPVAEARNKALAAAIAVTVLATAPSRIRRRQGDGG